MSKIGTNLKRIISSVESKRYKAYKSKIISKKILRPSERVGVVVQVAERKPTTIKNFIDASMIRGGSL